jgi:hypothetical protein
VEEVVVREANMSGHIIPAEVLAEALAKSDTRIRVAHGDGWRVPEQCLTFYFRDNAPDGVYKEYCADFCRSVKFHPVLNDRDKMRIFSFVWEGGWEPERWIEEDAGEGFLALSGSETVH